MVITPMMRYMVCMVIVILQALNELGEINWFGKLIMHQNQSTPTF